MDDVASLLNSTDFKLRRPNIRVRVNILRESAPSTNLTLKDRLLHVQASRHLPILPFFGTDWTHLSRLHARQHPMRDGSMLSLYCRPVLRDTRKTLKLLAVVRGSPLNLRREALQAQPQLHRLARGYNVHHLPQRPQSPQSVPPVLRYMPQRSQIYRDVRDGDSAVVGFFETAWSGPTEPRDAGDAMETKIRVGGGHCTSATLEPVALAWILKDADTRNIIIRLAVLRIHAAECPTLTTSRLPGWIFVQLLLALEFDPVSFRLFLALLWVQFGGPSIQVARIEAVLEVIQQSLYLGPSAVEKLRRSWTSTSRDLLEDSASYVPFSRLIRLARQVLPAALAEVADLYTHCLDREVLSLEPRVRDENGGRSQRWSHLSSCCNLVLSSLAIPNAQRPFGLMQEHKCAQNRILRYMRDSSPSLILDRRGFRALVTVQLALPKSSSERRWAELQSRSWPPWKKPRLGIESEDQPFEDESSTAILLQQAEAAGFPPREWELAAGILGGRDLDGTPTVQQRSLAVRYTGPGNRHSASDRRLGRRRGECILSRRIWIARIRATRTLNEAWSVFISCSETGLPSVAVHIAMLQKIVQAEVQQSQKTMARDTKDAQMLPGESREVLDPPLDPNEGIYVRIQVPSSAAFIEDSLRNGLGESTHYVSRCLRSVRSRRQIKSILKAASDPLAQQLLSLIWTTAGPTHLSPERAQILERIPSSLLSAFISALIQSAEDESRRILRSSSSMSISGISRRFEYIRSLLLARHRGSLAEWNSLLETMAMAMRGMTSIESRNEERTQIWRMMRDISISDLERISVSKNLQSVNHMLAGYVAIVEPMGEGASLGQAQPEDQSLETDECSSPTIDPSTTQFVEIRRMWYEVIGLGEQHQKKLLMRSHHRTSADHMAPLGKSDCAAVPELVLIPSAGDIHQFARALSLSQDVEGLFELVGFLDVYSTTLEARCREQPNGRIQIRRAVCSLASYSIEWPKSADALRPSQDIDGAVDGAEQEQNLKSALDDLLLRRSWLGGSIVDDSELDMYIDYAQQQNGRTEQVPQELDSVELDESIWERPVTSFGIGLRTKDPDRSLKRSGTR